MDLDPRDVFATGREDPAATGLRADREPPPARGLLQGIFEGRADAAPDAPAVIEDGGTVAYGDLERRANRIARFLRARGVRPGDLVAHLLPRSADAYAALLGILKSGAAYVPLDPECPPERCAGILEDCGASALVTIDALAARHRGFTGHVVRLDADRAPIDAGNPSRPRSGADPGDLCYVIYTSGSTGRPKGVMVEHRNAVHLVRAERRIFGVGPGDRVHQGFSLAFDASVEEVWLALASGAALVPASPAAARSGPDLPRLLGEAGVTVLSCVPTLLETFEGEMPSVRLLILGGEACPDGLAARWARPGRRIVNTYGPTEATVIATFADLRPGRPPTLGRPIPGSRVHVLDDLLRPVPAGAVGEISIGGPGVARGYLGLEARTRERFVPDPFAADGPGARLYRTGDLGSVGPDGDLRFHGRADSQVKVRGYRIELEEIEAVLLGDPAVRAAACALRDDAPGGQGLVAYVVPRNGKVPESRLREALAARLPAWMVPAALETVTDLPRLPSGKLDRASLPPPRRREAPVLAGGKGPRTPTEEKVAAAWGSLVAPLPVPRDADFFRDLGGHSLLAARAVSLLRKDPRLAGVSVIDVYENPTVARLAAALDAMAPPPRAPRETAAGPRSEARERLRHAGAGALQGAALYVVYGVRAAQWVTPYLVFFLLLEREVSVLAAAGWALAAAAATFPALLLFTIAAKWILLGRIRPGHHRLWGGYHVRWWLVQSLVTSLHLDYLGGTPLLPFVLRLFGARVGRDVQVATDDFAAFDLTSIGEGSTVDEESGLLGYAIQGGRLHVGSVTVGRGCLVGVQSILREGAVMEDGARLEDLSLLPAGARIPAGQTWQGSPARPVPGPRPETARREPPPSGGRPRRLARFALYAALALLLPLLVLSAFAPGVALLSLLDPFETPWLYVAAVPVAGASFVILLALGTVALKWILLGRVRPGVHPVHGAFYVRFWIVERLLQLGLDMLGPLRATLWLAPWYRALGARIGRFVELSTATGGVPDLLEVGDGGTVADEVSLGAPHVERGWMTLAPTRIGSRSFLGNSAVVPGGTALADGTLVGVLTLAPREPEEAATAGASWLGSPPFLLPRREPSRGFREDRTYLPPRRMVAARACWEVLRITLPPSGFIFTSAAVVTITSVLADSLGLAAALALVPAAYMAACAVVLLAVAAAKWILMGRYRPFERPLWSFFVWRLELSNALYEFLAAPLALDPLAGTPFLPWYFRLMGARIGRRVYVETTGLIEFDLVEVGDRATLNDACVLQSHLFEDRMLKASALRVGSGAVVGACSVVLHGAALEDGARMDALSLLMKGETLPAGTSWAGIPARTRRRAAGRAPRRIPSAVPAR